jgi:hypothetical protein
MDPLLSNRRLILFTVRAEPYFQFIRERAMIKVVVVYTVGMGIPPNK